MPIRGDLVEPNLCERLEADGVPIISPETAEEQEVYPLNIGLANMMPAKAMEATELQWSRWMGSVPMLQTGVKLIKFDNDCRERDRETGRLRSRAGHLQRYTALSDVDPDDVHCLVITGDDEETKPSKGMSSREPKGIDEIDYAGQLDNLLKWGEDNVPVTILSCLGAHFALNRLHGIKKDTTKTKTSGVFEHEIKDPADPLVRGLGDVVISPHSRWGNVPVESIEKHNSQSDSRELKILAVSQKVGWLLLKEELPNGHVRVYLQGHPEYDRDDLDAEYKRDLKHASGLKNENLLKGLEKPVDYYPDDDPSKTPRFIWEPHVGRLHQNILSLAYSITEARRRKALGLS